MIQQKTSNGTIWVVCSPGTERFLGGKTRSSGVVYMRLKDAIQRLSNTLTPPKCLVYIPHDLVPGVWYDFSTGERKDEKEILFSKAEAIGVRYIRKPADSIESWRLLANMDYALPVPNFEPKKQKPLAVTVYMDRNNPNTGSMRWFLPQVNFDSLDKNQVNNASRVILDEAVPWSEKLAKIMEENNLSLDKALDACRLAILDAWFGRTLASEYCCREGAFDRLSYVMNQANLLLKGFGIALPYPYQLRDAVVKLVNLCLSNTCKQGFHEIVTIEDETTSSEMAAHA